MNKQKYQFDITPHIVKQLGEQLVSDEITALLELIKNSYDADASYVSIEINTTGNYTKETLFYPNHQGFIVVEDDGFGMNEDTILKSWLIISYSQKRKFKEEKNVTPKGRTPLGEKGLGRLSTQRLANICEIFTNEEAKTGIHIGFNWKDFETEEKLGNVRVDLKKFTPKRKNGTTLVLSNINHKEVWEGNNLEKFKGLVSQIISPYKENRPFEVVIRINGILLDIDKSNEELRDLAISRFEFKFSKNKIIITGKTKLTKFIGNNRENYSLLLESDNGKKFLGYLEKKFNYIKISNKSNFFIEFERTFELENIGGLEIFDGEKANPGPFYGLIDEFSYDYWLSSDEALKEVFGKLSNYREFAQAQAGIKLFRDGFAIKPFGINAQDWLNLGDEQTGGASYYAMRPKNVIGYINISERDNSNLKDKTDREGLVSNPYSRNFFILAGFIKDEIIRYQENIRRSFNEFKNTYNNENSGIKTVSQAFNQLKETKAKTEDVKTEFHESLNIVDKAISDSQIIVKEVKGNPLFSTDSEKETANKVDVVLSELLKIKTTLHKLEQVVNRTEKLNEVINVLQPKIEILEEQLNNFSELASLGLTAESVSHEFASIADRLAERSVFYSNKLNSKKLTDSDIFVLMEYINSTVNGLKVQLKHLDPALKYNKEKKAIIVLSQFFKDEQEYYKNRFAQKNIELSIKDQDDFSVNINRGMLIQVIDNLFNNSEYWLSEKKRTILSFQPQISVSIEKPWIYISDNGFGISTTIEQQVFEPFVTTKPKGEGRGLGLFIIKQLLDSSGCSIILEPEKNKDGKRFIFAINLSNIIK